MNFCQASASVRLRRGPRPSITSGAVSDRPSASRTRSGVISATSTPSHAPSPSIGETTSCNRPEVIAR